MLYALFIVKISEKAVPKVEAVITRISERRSRVQTSSLLPFFCILVKCRR